MKHVGEITIIDFSFFKFKKSNISIGKLVRSAPILYKLKKKEY